MHGDDRWPLSLQSLDGSGPTRSGTVVHSREDASGRAISFLTQEALNEPVIQRKVLTPNDFTSLTERDLTLLAFHSATRNPPFPFNGPSRARSWRLAWLGPKQRQRQRPLLQPPCVQT